MKCKVPSKGKLTPKQMKMHHKMRLLNRRQRQLERMPDLDARLVYFSKNSISEYRKN